MEILQPPAPIKDLDKSPWFFWGRFEQEIPILSRRSSSRSIFIPTPPGRMTRQRYSRASCDPAAQEIQLFWANGGEK